MIGYCVDVGSIHAGRFAWARAELTSTTWVPATSASIESLADRLAEDLTVSKVALGFEAPLYVPIRKSPDALAQARRGEGRRPWSAGAGISVMGTALVQAIWLLHTLRARFLDGDLPPVFLSWADFDSSANGLFLWEAFVSEGGKVAAGALSAHERDAVAGLEALRNALPDPTSHDCIDEDTVHSLIGGALLHTRWSTDIELLRTPCLVLRAKAGAS